MFVEMRRALGVALCLSLCGGASAALAQVKQPWVDPPPETGIAPELPNRPEEPPVPLVAGSPEPAAQTAAPAEPSLSKPRSAQTSPSKSEGDSAARPKKQTEASPAAPEPTRSAEERAKAEAKGEAKRARAAGGNASTGVASTGVASTGSLPASETTTPHKRPSATRKATSKPGPGLADRRPGGRRIRTVREALAAGFEVRNLRTIEFADGRRITVLTRPDPETMRNLLEEPHALVPP